MIKISDVSLLDLLPPNLRYVPSLSAAAQAIDAERKDILDAINKLALFPRLNSLTDVEADELAWQWHVDFYDPSLPLDQRRELVKKSYAWHRRKGTPSAVEELIRTIFGDGEVQEWFEYGGQPGMFKVITSNSSTTSDMAQEFLEAIKSIKNVRSHLEAIEVTATEDMNLYWAGVVQTGDFLTLRQVN